MRRPPTHASNAALIALIGLCGLAGAPVRAGVPSTIAPSPFASNTLSSPAVGQFGAATPITVLCGNGGVANNECRIVTFGLTGTNAADFALAGGSCVPGVTILSNAGTCTVNVQYRASGSAEETALLQAQCVTVSVLGGFSVLCNNSLQSFDTLFGLFLPPAAVPAFDRTGIALLSLLLLGVGSFFALRRAPLRR